MCLGGEIFFLSHCWLRNIATCTWYSCPGVRRVILDKKKFNIPKYWKIFNCIFNSASLYNSKFLKFKKKKKRKIFNCSRQFFYFLFLRCKWFSRRWANRNSVDVSEILAACFVQPLKKKKKTSQRKKSHATNE